jgi:hypothetical protein
MPDIESIPEWAKGLLSGTALTALLGFIFNRLSEREKNATAREANANVRDKNQADAEVAHGAQMLQAFAQFQAIETQIREDFNVQLLELRSDLTIVTRELNEAKHTITGMEHTITGLEQQVKDAHKEAEHERALREAAEGKVASLTTNQALNEGRITALESLLTSNNITFNGGGGEGSAAAIVTHTKATDCNKKATEANTEARNPKEKSDG